MTLPNLVLIGAPKCGTTSLFHWLAAHPEVSVGERKEAQYLSDEGSSIFRAKANYRDHGLDGYAALFPAGKVVFDATPGYLYQRTALEVLAKQVPEAKLLVVLRDPVERFFSVHRYYSANQPVLDHSVSAADLFERSLAGDQTLPANEFVRDAVAHSEYVRYLDTWAAACGRDRLLVERAEDLRRQPREVLERLAAWTGLDPQPLLSQTLTDHNVSYEVRNQGVQRAVARVRNFVPMGPARKVMARTYRRLNVREAEPAVRAKPEPSAAETELRARLAAHYAPWNARLADEWGIDTSAWGTRR